MSLSGDSIVIRNGRSTSQVSIYNYPEHLNPFYEDDQHKRLRFWHINKNDKKGRRNSFSISGLKDMWAFRSLRLNKKRSPMLGINKTSESPPALRRETQFGSLTDNGSYTCDPRSKYFGLTHSLQDMRFVQDCSNGLGFNRNHQSHCSSQIIDGASKTMPLHRRLSQSSVNTNPFATDYRELNMNDSVGKNTHSYTMLRKQRIYKKRQAPAPPDLVQITNIEGMPLRPTVLGTKEASELMELHIKENIDIINLSAEIENFVKESSAKGQEDKEPPKQVLENSIELSPSSGTEGQKENVQNSTSSVERNSNELEPLKQENCDIECIHINIDKQHTITERNPLKKFTSFLPDEKIDNEKTTQKNIFTVPSSDIEKGSFPADMASIQSASIECNAPTIAENNLEKIVSTSIGKSQVENASTTNRDLLEARTRHATNINEETVCVSSKYTNKPLLGNKPCKEDETSIKNTNLDIVFEKQHTKKEDVTAEASPKRIVDGTETDGHISPAVTLLLSKPLKIVELDKTDTNFRPIHSYKPHSPLEWKHSTLAPLETHVPPEKRKSVKDIIESINRSQRLLQLSANQSQRFSNSFITQNTPPPQYKFIELDNLEKSRNLDSSSRDTAHDLTKSDISKASYQMEDMTSDISTSGNRQCDPMKLNNTEVFEKFTFKKAFNNLRESSPTTSNLDWNPVPKPKRTKNLSDL